MPEQNGSPKTGHDREMERLRELSRQVEEAGESAREANRAVERAHEAADEARRQSRVIDTHFPHATTQRRPRRNESPKR